MVQLHTNLDLTEYIRCRKDVMGRRRLIPNGSSVERQRMAFKKALVALTDLSDCQLYLKDRA
jgi:hypothetical protein